MSRHVAGRAPALLTIVVIATTPAEAGRFWYSLDGVGENEPITGTPGEYIDHTTGINPVINAGLGTVDLYIWGTLDVPGQFYNSLAFDVTIYPTQGDLSITDSIFYNYNDPDYGIIRWDHIDQGSRTGHKVDDIWSVVYVAGYGFSGHHLDTQYDPITWSMLLGVITLEMTPDAQGDIFFAVGARGFGSQPPAQPVYFGWGDDPLEELDIGLESTLADATVVPEPSILCGILTCTVVLGARRFSK